MLVDVVSNDAAPEGAALGGTGSEDLGTVARDAAAGTPSEAPVDGGVPPSAGQPIAEQPPVDGVVQADDEEIAEPWVSPGWTTPREPPGPGEVPLANLPPPDAVAEVDAAEVDARVDAEADAGPDAEAEAETASGAVAASPSVQPGDRPHRPRLLIAAVAVAVVASLVALAQAQDARDLRDQRDDQRTVTDVAERFGAAYLSFDYAHPDRSGKAVTALATEELAESYAARSAPEIQQLFSSAQTTTKATTTAVYLGAVAGSRARALVVVDVTATSPTDGEQQLDDVSFVLDLQRTSAGWRVSKVARAPQPQLSTTTTSTTAAPGAAAP
jgi:hypothetical protein